MRDNWLHMNSGMYCYRNGEKVPSSEEEYCPHISTRYRNFEKASDAGKLPELYSSRVECCGCGACEFACPTDAITMELDEEGFRYPVIDAAACVACKRCISACSFQLSMSGEPSQ